MHDELLERRLRSALREEVDRLPFTITLADVEGRLGHRRGLTGNARLTLLLAAAVTIGAIAGSIVIGGLSNRPVPSTAADSSAAPSPASSPDSSDPASRSLPTLDALIAADPARLLIAQAFGPAAAPPDAIPTVLARDVTVVGLGDLQAGGDYQVAVACLGRIPLEVGVVPSGEGQAIAGPRFACDGAVHEEVIRVDGAGSAFVRYRGETSWRVVIRGDRRQLPLPTADATLEPLGSGIEALVDQQAATVDPGAEPYGSTGLRLRGLGGVPARQLYAADVWCPAGASVRLLFADQAGSTLLPSMDTALACDGLVHMLNLDVALPNGSPVLVAAAPGVPWSVRILSATPPVSLAEDIPGWVVVGGVGPSLHFVESSVSFSDTVGDRGGPLMVVVGCAGADRDIAVDIDATGILGDAFEQHTAACSAIGRRTTFTINTGPTGYLVRQDAPLGTWTALTLLVPEGSPSP